MSSLTIELPENLDRQIKRKGLSQQQLQQMLVKMIQLYLHENHQQKADLSIRPEKAGNTLLDLRGSVPVEQAQDFDAIRQEVIHKQFRTRIHDAD